MYTAPIKQETPVEMSTSTVVSLIEKKAEENGLNYKTAIAVARAESGFNTKEYNPEWHYNIKHEKVCQGSYGLFQIACVNYPGDPKDLYDPELNIDIAVKLYKERGWQPWSVCKEKVNCL